MAAKTKSNGSDVNKNKLWAILAYFIFFLPLITAKNSKYAMHHANQSLILLLLNIAANIAGAMVPMLGGLVAFVVGVGVFVLWIMGIISAANGDTKPLPVIGRYTLLK